ncbi:MAG TPA: exonuclease domain-containing protein, partial [Desulfotignum sp.]|nr:exonuclease domain-containing protein [Desulfotignum sp.]
MTRKNTISDKQPLDWGSRFSLLADQARDPRLKAYYRAAHIPGHTPVKQVKFLALDMETTGLDPKTDAIISVGFLPLFHDRILCSGARYWVVRPDHPIPDIQTTIHGITHTRMHTCPDFSTILEPLLQAMAGRVVLVHYHHIERHFLDRTVLDTTGDTLVFPVVDTME